MVDGGGGEELCIVVEVCRDDRLKWCKTLRTKDGVDATSRHNDYLPFFFFLWRSIYRLGKNYQLPVFFPGDLVGIR